MGTQICSWVVPRARNPFGVTKEGMGHGGGGGCLDRDEYGNGDYNQR